ncbi:MAG TPA: SDR family NAD(P)-dependent oxidoreductase [Methylococcaceae bacterium]|jgi:NAD(P)-dependent dehydrogenase (short-subunit alcohol dehydrogenase family)|nr:SDR family NAD(P)-dependent oxidoreductase [Methylococcaceae bacterium]HIN68112.1 SDR family NAD(P)-dependent oxidoreductase [Methylococcales bacterium]HIA45412.1 SDR family NAD(P)-dependent oxidoreductase [Methylococcaceae bacterium]HIB63044.1 SDR family NAD(P)-dependent oxidoreductase [Methylococcaceae bacterium]HIO13343.1 SDR family NAD(P)-dependent oxidoreductase [Methylococcales bacterium]
MSQQVFLVTGATGAIGKAIARQCAIDHNHTVVLACRNEEKAKSVINEIIQLTGNLNVFNALVDLSNYQEICQLAERWSGPLHVLINNAATTPRRRQETRAGIELQMATNVLGYFWMVKAFTDILKDSGSAQIINVASYWAGDLDLNDLEFNNRPYNNNIAYRQSKQANRMLSVAFSDKLKAYRINVNACHPGDVNSTLSNNLGFGGYETPDQGAQTPVWLATRPYEQQSTGGYYEHMRAVPCLFGRGQEAIQKLFIRCETYTRR